MNQKKAAFRHKNASGRLLSAGASLWRFARIGSSDTGYAFRAMPASIGRARQIDAGGTRRKIELAVYVLQGYSSLYPLSWLGRSQK